MCRTGCKTKEHASYAECLRSARPQVGPMWTGSKQTNRDLSAYADARRQGIQPEGTKADQVEAAVRASDAAGRAYDASTGGFK